jgi:hypothetical protein
VLKYAGKYHKEHGMRKATESITKPYTHIRQRLTGLGSTGTIMLFLVCVVSVFLLRSLWTYPILHGDAVQKYFWAAEIVRTGEWGFLLHNHHTLRWTMMLPQTGLTWLLGIRYELFFILSLLTFSLYLVLIVFSLRNILNHSQLVLLAVILFVEPAGLGTSNQLLNPPAGILFAFAGALTLVSHAKRGNLAIVFSAVLFFIAYGAHVTYLSFAAGGFFWLLLFRRNWNGAIIFCASILLLMIIETGVFNYLSGWELSWGRLELLAGGSHAQQVIEVFEPVAPVQLLDRWLKLSPSGLILSLGFFMAAPLLVWLRKKGLQVPAIIECSYLVGLCFAVAITFAVVSFNPIKPMMPLRPMYLLPFLPFAAIMSVYILSKLVPKIPVINRSHAQSVINLVLIAILLYLYSSALQVRFVALIWRADSEYTEFSDRFRRGELILTGKRHNKLNQIARFKYPVKTSRKKFAISALNPSPDALCVTLLNRLPLHLNYQRCDTLMDK